MLASNIIATLTGTSYMDSLIGKWIFDKRQEHRPKLSQEQLAVRAKTSRAYISLLERGGEHPDTGKRIKPDPEKLMRIAEVLSRNPIEAKRYRTEIIRIAATEAGYEQPDDFLKDLDLDSKTEETLLSQLQELISQLKQGDIAEVLHLVEYKLRMPSEPTSTSSVLPSSRYQYDIEEHRLYTHDGKPASKSDMQKFLIDVDNNILGSAISQDEQENVVSRHFGG